MTERRRAGVLGHPIGHSLSPVLHLAAYRALGLPWDYEAYDVTVEQLSPFLNDLDDGWAGLSLTMPLKVEALRHMDVIEPLARSLGAVNTVLVQRVGDTLSLVGANTDVHGVVAALEEAGVARVSSAVILGGGATATSAMAALAQLGCTAPIIAVRSRARAAGLMAAQAATGLQPVFVDFEEAADVLERAEVVVSTVPIEAGRAVGERLRSVAQGAVLLDVIYHPPVTPLAESWAAAGGRVVPGVRMLLHQAGEQVRLMTGRPAPLKEMDAALVSHLSG